MTGHAIGSARFSPEDQRAFTEMSGDDNPIHRDATYARRQLAGRPIVHGIHLLLAGLERLLDCDEATHPQGIAELGCRFENPGLLHASIDYEAAELADGTTGVEAWSSGLRLFQASFRLQHDSPLVEIGRARDAPRAAPRDLQLSDLSELEGELELASPPSLMRQHLPAVSRRLAPATLAELLAVSRLVGMECPGLRSLLAELALRRAPSSHEGLSYRVGRVIAPLRRVTIDVAGPTLAGSVVAFVRPDPQSQPSVERVARRVDGGEFAGQDALIVGGTRGLGEITAKIFAMGGGRPTITHAQGRDDAARVASEIGEMGAECLVEPLDVVGGGGLQPTLKAAFDQIYYFASPRIFVAKPAAYQTDLYERLAAYFVAGVESVYTARRRASAAPFVLFYPSSDAVTEETANLAEYTAAKVAGEQLCERLDSQDPRLQVVVHRLPRVATDQTISLIPFPAADALDVMLPIVREMTRRSRSFVDPA